MMRYLFRMLGGRKGICLIAVAAVFACIFQFYIPSFKYLAYKTAGGRVELKGCFSIRMADDWLPVYFFKSSSECYVLFAKINPWFPTGPISTLDLSYRFEEPTIDLANNPRTRAERFGWGEALFLDHWKTAFPSNTGMRIHFTNHSDLNDILELKQK